MGISDNMTIASCIIDCCGPGWSEEYIDLQWFACGFKDPYRNRWYGNDNNALRHRREQHSATYSPLARTRSQSSDSRNNIGMVRLWFCGHIYKMLVPQRHRNTFDLFVLCKHILPLSYLRSELTSRLPSIHCHFK